MSDQCPNCEEEFEPEFDTCWKCGSNKDGIVIDDLSSPDEPTGNSADAIKTLNIVGLLTGTFFIRQKRESVPKGPGDFVLPEWAVPVVVGVVACIVALYFANPGVAWFGAVAIIVGAIMFALQKFMPPNNREG